jgi:hypothetical protein
MVLESCLFIKYLIPSRGNFTTGSEAHKRLIYVSFYKYTFQRIFTAMSRTFLKPAFLFAIAAMTLLPGCFLFKKKCDCPKVGMDSKHPSDQRKS